MKYCSKCGAVVEQKIPAGDNRHRYVCNSCHTIHYENPCIIAGCLPVYQDQVLLCKRAIEPRYGLWTLPAGFMENGESTEQAALRETLEEANAQVVIRSLYTMTSILHVDQVQMIYLADMPEPKFSISDESLEVELFRESEIPWDALAFPTITNALKFYFSDRKTGQFPLRHLEMSRSDAGELYCELGTHQ